MRETFEMVEQGDIVIGRGRFSADIRIVEYIDKCEQGEDADRDIFRHILLVNGIRDLSYSGREIEAFNEEWRLFGKKEDLLYV